jgi:thiamine-monophosphate kinase
MKRLTEDGLIDWIRRRTPEAAARRAGVKIGIGDDAAVVRCPDGTDLVLKTDMIVENIHFTRKTSRPEDWGYKAMAVNLSDLAAMGAAPRYALAAVGLPRGTRARDAQAIQRGMERAMRLGGVSLVGGDTCRSERVTLAVFVAGSVKRGKMILRSGARPGDVLFVTGKLGGSLASGRHLKFVPRLAESDFLTRHYRVNAMMDISDGLAKDLRQLGAASGAGIEIFEKSVPLHRDVLSRGADAAFLDGEDFELVFALGPREAARLERDPRPRRRKFTFYRIGRVVHEKKGFTRVTQHGTHRPFPPAPDHHFGPR